jgi:transposase
MSKRRLEVSRLDGVSSVILAARNGPNFTTNYYTYIASTNTRNQRAQRGHNKQGRHNLRQVGLSYVLDGEHGFELMSSRLSFGAYEE